MKFKGAGELIFAEHAVFPAPDGFADASESGFDSFWQERASELSDDGFKTFLLPFHQP